MINFSDRPTMQAYNKVLQLLINMFVDGFMFCVGKIHIRSKENLIDIETFLNFTIKRREFSAENISSKSAIVI